MDDDDVGKKTTKIRVPTKRTFLPIKEAQQVVNQYLANNDDDDDNIRVKKEEAAPRKQQEKRERGPEFEAASMPELSIDTKTKFFEHRLAQTSHNADDYVMTASIPKLSEIGKSLDILENGGGGDTPWYQDSPGKNVPELEWVSPEYVAQFLQPPSSKRDRLCLPPCHPKTGEFLVCESVEMGGPMLKEFLLPSQVAATTLPTQQRPCWLCTQRSITMAFNLNKKDDTTAGTKEIDFLIHEYKMIVNVTGGYKIELILPGFKKFLGIIGPVLAHNREHYVLLPGNAGWKQSDKMLFRDGATNVQ